MSDQPSWLKPLLSKVHAKVLSKYYGCGLVCPTALEGLKILDLGCGSGRDVYVLSQLVGATGFVVGVDMTDEQLEVANECLEYHKQAVGYDNVKFVNGFIEQLDDLGLEPNSFDIIVSNCVVNLSPDKDAVLRGVKNLLKPGGEFYFSDVYVDRRLHLELKNDPVLYGECLAGALYKQDFITLAKSNGFHDPRLVEVKPINIGNEKLAALLGNAVFTSETYRLFKIDDLEPYCEDYGQAVVYKGTIENSPTEFSLDMNHKMETGRVFPVCGNTWQMLQETRFKNHFDFVGDFSRHFGLFDGCGEAAPQNNAKAAGEISCC